MYIVILRSIQSVLHTTALSRAEADRIAEHMAVCLNQPGMLEQAAARYRTNDVYEIGGRAAREYLERVGGLIQTADFADDAD